MKKIIIPSILVAIILSIMAVAIFALNSKEDSEAVKPSTFDTLLSVITSEEEVFQVSKFNQKEIFADLSRDNMREIFNAFDIVLEKYDTIEIKDTIYHRALFDHEGIEYKLTDDINLWGLYYIGEEEQVLNHSGKIIVDTNQNRDCLKYAMFSSVYMELFPKNWTYGYTAEQLQTRNLMWSPSIKVIPDYEEYGFESAFDAFQSFSGRTEGQFTFSTYSAVDSSSIKLYKEINEIMEKSEDSYALEYFFFRLQLDKKGYENYPMIKKDSAIK